MKILKDPDFRSVQTQIENARRRTITIVVPGGIILIVSFAVTLIVLWFGLFLMVIGLSLAIGGSPNFGHIRRLKAGMKGEQDVINELRSLDDSWCLINSIRLSGMRANIDHVLVGPGGVFVLETKNHRGGIVCEGDEWFRGNWTPKRRPRKRKHTRSPNLQAKGYASELKRTLGKAGVHVQPVVVFTNPYAKLWLKKPSIPVLQLGELPSYFKTAVSEWRLEESQISAIATSIVASGTRGDLEDQRASKVR